MAYTLVLAGADVDTLGEVFVAIIFCADARVHLILAVRTSPPRCTCARVAIGRIRARRAILARCGLAVIIVDLAVVTAVALGAHAGVPKHMVEALAAVKAGV